MGTAHKPNEKLIQFYSITWYNNWKYIESPIFNFIVRDANKSKMLHRPSKNWLRNFDIYGARLCNFQGSFSLPNRPRHFSIRKVIFSTNEFVVFISSITTSLRSHLQRINRSYILRWLVMQFAWFFYLWIDIRDFEYTFVLVGEE